MKPGMLTFGLALVLTLSACVPSVPPTPPLTATPENLTLKTAVGDLAIASARQVDEVNGVQAGAGEKILLVILTQPGQSKLAPDAFSLEAFQTALQDRSNGQVHLSTDAGSESICTMAGWVEDEFALGFRVPATAKTYTFVWPGNAPLTIVPDN